MEDGISQVYEDRTMDEKVKNLVANELKYAEPVTFQMYYGIEDLWDYKKSLLSEVMLFEQGTDIKHVLNQLAKHLENKLPYFYPKVESEP